MDRDNMYSRFGSFTPRSSFLDSIPPLPWMHTDTTAPGNYPPSVMEDPRMKPPASHSALPLYLEGPGIAGSSDASRYYNDIPFPNESVYGNNFDSPGQISQDRFSSKNPESQFRGPLKGPIRHPSYFTDLIKGSEQNYIPHCQNSTITTKSGNNYKFAPAVKYPDSGTAESNMKAGPVFPKGPFVSGVAAASVHNNGQNLESSTENPLEEVIEKGLESYNLDQQRHLLDGIENKKATDTEGTLNLSKDATSKIIDKQNFSMEPLEQTSSEKGESSRDTSLNSSTNTSVGEGKGENEPLNTSSDKDVQTPEASTTTQRTTRKRRNDLEIKQILSLIGNLDSKAKKTEKGTSGGGTLKEGQKNVASGPSSKKVVKIIRVIRNKDGQFMKMDPGKVKLLLKKKPTAIVKKGKGWSNPGRITGTGKVSGGKRKQKSKTEGDGDEESVVTDDSKSEKKSETKGSGPQVIYVKPVGPTPAPKQITEEPPKAQIHDNDSYPNCMIMSLGTTPNQLYLGASKNTEHGIGVFCKFDIPKGTQFGPVIGEKILFQDLSPDMNFHHIWYFPKDEEWKDLEFINTVSENHSNWCRYILPSVEKDSNLIRLVKDQAIYLISRRHIKAGEELIYYAKSFDDFKGTRKSSSVVEKPTDEEAALANHCRLCNFSFLSDVNYLKHCQIYHTFTSAKTRSQCRICNAIFLSRRELKKHVRCHEGSAGGEYICPICGKAYVYQTQLKEHVKVNHYEEPTECDECGKICMNPRKLQNHKNRKHSNRSFQCDKCKKIFRQKAILQRHQKIHDDIYTVACDRCGKLFRDKHNLKVHLLTHSGVKPFQCSMPGCSAAFTVKQCLQGHYRKVHGYNDFNMPEIRRSVPFTDDAYMGQDEVEVLKF